MDFIPLSRLQQHILHWLALEHLRTPSPAGPAYADLVASLPYPPTSIALSLQRLARRGFVHLTRSRAGRIQAVHLTAAGHLRVTLLSTDGPVR